MSLIRAFVIKILHEKILHLRFSITYYKTKCGMLTDHLDGFIICDLLQSQVI